jgi:hypothetical protein
MICKPIAGESGGFAIWERCQLKTSCHTCIEDLFSFFILVPEWACHSNKRNPSSMLSTFMCAYCHPLGFQIASKISLLR